MFIFSKLSSTAGAEGAYTAFGEVYQSLKSINGGAGVYFGKALLALKSVSVDAD